jgi:hypothetical protein
MRVEDLLNLARKELFPPAVDDLLAPTDDLDVACRVDDTAEVAGAEPAIGGKGLGIGGGVGVIAQVDAGAQGRDLADLALLHLQSQLVQDLELHARDHAPDCAVDFGRVIAEARVGVKARLQHTIELDQVARHACLVVANCLDCGGGTTGYDDAQRGHIVTREPRLVEDGHDRGRCGRNVGDALALDQLERSFR